MKQTIILFSSTARLADEVELYPQQSGSPVHSTVHPLNYVVVIYSRPVRSPMIPFQSSPHRSWTDSVAWRYGAVRYIVRGPNRKPPSANKKTEGTQSHSATQQLSNSAISDAPRDHHRQDGTDLTRCGSGSATALNVAVPRMRYLPMPPAWLDAKFGDVAPLPSTVLTVRLTYSTPYSSRT